MQGLGKDGTKIQALIRSTGDADTTLFKKLLRVIAVLSGQVPTSELFVTLI